MSQKFLKGFESNVRQLEVANLPVEGYLPDWLAGSLLRTGPAIYEVGNERLLHWFDGLGALHRFSFAGGQVSYAYRILQSTNYKAAMQEKRITSPQFGTNPRQTVFAKMLNILKPFHNDNGVVNIVQHGKDFMAVTESPDVLCFDPRTLQTLGAFGYQDSLPTQTQTAHPHYDYERQALINLAVKFGQKSAYYFYWQKVGSHERKVIAELPTKNISYIHSFATTQNYIILVEFPFFFNLAWLVTGLKTFAESANWNPSEPTRFWVIRKSDGKLLKTYESAPFFCFHQINAFEENGDIFIDLSAYSDSSIIQNLYLAALAEPYGGNLPHAYYRRYHLPANSSRASYTLLTDVHFEIPQLNYPRFGAKPYRYSYGMSIRSDRSNDFYNALVKVDTQTGATKFWQADDCYPGEPVFVARPGATSEDDGVNLSEVLDGNTGCSFLLVLDAATFEEIGRATLPDFIPFNFHGMFAEGV